jgi:hypothetical protein
MTYIKIGVMLTSASETLVKEGKRGKFYIEKNIFYTLKSWNTQVPRKFYYIKHLN